MAIETAFVLAAGRGERLKPLTDILPKPLLPIRGKPAICGVFDSLIEIGVKSIVVNTWHLADKFKDVLGDSYRGAKLTFVREDELLDTGGGFKNILRLLDADSPVIVHNGDIFFDAPLSDFSKAAEEKFAKNKNLCAALCLRKDGTVKNVRVRNGKVVDMRSITGIDGDEAQYTGVFAAYPKIFPYLKNDGRKVFSIVDTFVSSILADTSSVEGIYENRGIWLDIGTPKSYVDLNSGEYERDFFPRLAKLAVLGFFAENFTKVNTGASVRDFFLFDDKNRDGQKLVACFYSGEKTENYLYAAIADFLSSNEFPVPRVLYHDARERILIMENAGERDILSLSPSERMAALMQTAHIARDLHSRITDIYSKDASLSKSCPLCPPFDDKLYDWEQNYFFGECVRSRFSMSDIKIPQKEFDLIKKVLNSQRQCIIHRDLQSQNAMVSNCGKVSLIDFQGMRFGCPMYDLASLVFDPYLNLAESERKEIVLEYFGTSPDEKQLYTFYVAATERLMQALGAYGFLSLKKGMKVYENYFRPALENLSHCSERAELFGIENIARKCLGKL